MAKTDLDEFVLQYGNAQRDLELALKTGNRELVEITAQRFASWGRVGTLFSALKDLPNGS